MEHVTVQPGRQASPSVLSISRGVDVAHVDSIDAWFESGTARMQ
jgi:hypothetical protein